MLFSQEFTKYISLSFTSFFFLCSFQIFCFLKRPKSLFLFRLIGSWNDIFYKPFLDEILVLLVSTIFLNCQDIFFNFISDLQSRWYRNQRTVFCHFKRIWKWFEWLDDFLYSFFICDLLLSLWAPSVESRPVCSIFDFAKNVVRYLHWY